LENTKQAKRTPQTEAAGTQTQGLHVAKLEEYQDRPLVTIIRIETAKPDNALDDDMDMGSLPGCLGFYQQPEQGYVCSTCCHQELCKETTPTPAVVIEDKS